MEYIINYVPTNSCLYYYLCHANIAPYVRTAGTVFCGYILFSWIWHIILVLCTPLVVSLVAIVLVCPTTLEWFVNQFGPIVKRYAQSYTCMLLDKISTSINF